MFRKAIVIDVNRIDGIQDENGYSTSPERDRIVFKPLNCTSKQFIDWYCTVHEVCSDGEVIIDLGGQYNLPSKGELIEVSYDEYMEAWLNYKVWAIKNQIRFNAEMAIKEIIEVNNEG